MPATPAAVFIIASALAALLGWVICHRARHAIRFDLHKIPGPRQAPLIGNLASVIGSSYVHRVLAQWTTQFGSVFKWNLAGTTILVITDPDEVHRLCGRDANLGKPRIMYKHMNPREPHNNILGTPDFEEWKYFRKMMNPAFSPDNLRKVERAMCDTTDMQFVAAALHSNDHRRYADKAFPKIYQASVKAKDVLQKLSSSSGGGSSLVDMSSIAGRITAEVIGTAFFDVEMDALDYSVEDDGSLNLSERPYLQHLKRYQDHLTLSFTNPLHALMLKLFPWLAQAKEVKDSITGIQQYEDHLAEEICQRGKQPDSDTNLWACLGRLVNYKDNSPLPRQTLAANAGIFFAAGYETTAHAITWALFELAADPNLQNRVRKELTSAGLAPTPGHPPLRHLDFADLSKMKMLDSVVKETLRLHSTAPLGTTRITERDMVIKGYRIPKGVTLMFTPLPMHLSPFNFTHPNRFWPDRWTTGVIADWDPKRSDYPDATPAGNRQNLAASWNPFSTGPRNCIGQALALAELRTVLAVLVANFLFELPEGVQREEFLEKEEVWWVTLQAKHGLPLKVTPVTGEEKKRAWSPPKSDFYSQELMRLVKEAEDEGNSGQQ